MRYLDDHANVVEVRTASNAYGQSQDQGQPEPEAWGRRYLDQSNRQTTHSRYSRIHFGKSHMTCPSGS